MNKKLSFILLAGLLAGPPMLTAAEDKTPLPYGHPDFVPTTERPMGYQGDGNGHFPGATMVSDFWDGMPVPGAVEMLYGKKNEPALVYADQVSKNILWKTPLPGWSYSKPIPVKGRLYGIAEPDWVYCADQKTGKILWQERLTLASVEPKLAGKPDEQRKRQEIYDIGRAVCFVEIPFRNPRRPDVQKALTSQQDPIVGQALAAMQKMKARMLELDPDPKLQAAFDEEIGCIVCFRDEGREAMQAKYGGMGLPKGVVTNGSEPSGSVPSFISGKYQVALKPLWTGWCPGAVSVPVSDGDRIFVSMFAGQVAAYDLDGMRLWTKQHSSKHQIGVGHFPSPLIVKNPSGSGPGLVVMRDPLYTKKCPGGSLIAYRTDNGEKIWETKLNPATNHGNFQTPFLLRNPGPDGKGLDLIVTQSDAVLRATDGRVLADNLTLPLCNRKADGHASARIGRGDRFTAGVQGDAMEEDGIFHITWEGSQPKVVFERHFDVLTGGPRLKRGGLSIPNTVLMAGAPVVINGTGIWNVENGQVLASFQAAHAEYAGRCGGIMCMIGRTALSLEDQHSHRLRKDLSVARPFRMMEVTDPLHPRFRSCWNLLGGSEYPTDCVFETWLPGVDMGSFWFTAYSGLPSWFAGGQCAPLAQGERTFIQSYKYLYGIGPAIKGTATDDPKQVAGIRAETDQNKLVALLANPSAQYRLEAVRRLTTASEALTGLAVKDPYEEIRAAALETLERIKPGEGRAVLTKELEAFGERTYPFNSIQESMDLAHIALTCHLQPALADGVLSELLSRPRPAKPSGKVEPTARFLAVAEKADATGPAIEKACAALIAVSKPASVAGSKPIPGTADHIALKAAEVLAWAGKISTHAEAITVLLEAQLPFWSEGAPDAWKAFDDLFAIPAQQARLLALLGSIVANDKANKSSQVWALRRIEALGSRAASLKPQIEVARAKSKENPWLDRILAGMG